MIAALAIVALVAIIVLLIHENRRLTNLLLSKNPAAAVAAEKAPKAKKKERDDRDPTRKEWTNPSEAVGP